ncbi:MAG: hypothetical protein ABR577_03550 [Pyrinomonadaceae bacterium]
MSALITLLLPEALAPKMPMTGSSSMLRPSTVKVGAILWSGMMLRRFDSLPTAALLRLGATVVSVTGSLIER